jgi:signal transduction histidine kinase
MLSNYEALTDAQVDELYANVQQLAKMNPDIAEDIAVSGRLVDAYYLMSKGKYSQALPLLMKAYPMQVNSARSKWLLQMAITAATHCGNDAALLKAYKAYLPLVEHQFNSSEEDRLLEYQVLYDVNSLNAYNADLEAQYARAEAQQRKTGMYVAIAAIVLLVVILGLLYYAYRRTKRLTENLADANKLLIGERDNLRRIQKELILARDQSRQAERHKTDFINSISHELTEPVEAILGYSQLIVDSVEGTRRDVLDKFVQIIELNAQMLRTIVNDVLDVAELENSRVVVKFKNATLKEICEFSAETVRQRVKPGVELVVDELGWNECGACCIDTDPLRAEQVIINLLINSAKFTEKGRIAVFYGMDNVSNRAQIIVEDTGPGIPKGMERRIFERFYKGSPVNQGVGLGLTICRLVSQLLGGEVTLDNTYTTGSRFIFTLPINKVDKAAHIVPVV